MVNVQFDRIKFQNDFNRQNSYSKTNKMDIKGDKIMPLNFKCTNADVGSPGWAAVQIPTMEFFMCIGTTHATKICT